MKFCEQCGKELPEDATLCRSCGCEVDEVSIPTPVETPQSVSGKPAINKLWIILGAAALVLVVIIGVLFVPRDLEMDDFKKTNVVTAIMQYGLPEDFRTDDDGNLCLSYGGKVDFYGITPMSFNVYPDENRMAFLFYSDDAYDVYDKIARYCDFEEALYAFHKFSYEDMEITTNDFDGGYVSIEFY